MDMQKPPERIEQELKALRDLIQTHPHVQELLDLAADEADRRAMEKDVSIKRAWRVSGVLGGVAMLALAVAGGAVMTSMQPAPPPLVLALDKSNGFRQPLIALSEYQMNPDEATIRRNIATFLPARERYSYENADADYLTAAAFMSPQLKAQWVEYWKDPKESPINKYKQHGKVRIVLGPITLLRNPAGAFISARAGFTRQEVVNGQPSGKPTNYIATIPFHWVNQPTDEQARRINDLGMEITDYVVDRDLGGAPQPAESAPAARPAQGQGSTMALAAPGNGQQVSP
jgi:type IV secretion system protein VirB8